MGKICVVGSLNMDLTIYTEKMPLLGETMHGHDFITNCGGKGANQAVAVGKLGGDVSMIGLVGNDDFGRALIQNLKNNHVDTSAVEQLDGTATGIAMITVVNGNNFIILNGGANQQVEPDYIDRHIDKIREADIIVLQLEIPIKTVAYTIKLAKELGKKVILDPAPAQKLPEEIYQGLYLIKPNETEVSILTGKDSSTEEGVLEGIQNLKKLGVTNAMVTVGKDGVIFNDGNETLHKYTPSVKVADTTAAGDCFTGALALSLSKGNSMEDSVAFANAAATVAVMREGAQASLPTYEEAIDCYRQYSDVFEKKTLLS